MSQKESVQHIEAGSLPPVKETINKRLALINLYAAGGTKLSNYIGHVFKVHS